ncbi:ThiF family adenylyltransferase [Candidatus Woesearchaeota archaeon]|nr:ThiF family adenylyltransferase [Candidatus Woesearchaeota archaeon]
MRYIRQEIFKEIGKKGQEKLGKSTIAIVGLGALGSNSAELLARAGIGKLVLIDRDIVELSNLQRQRLFNENDIGKPKALAAKEHLNKINSNVEIDFFIDDLNFENINKILNKKIDLILDCTDNLETRFLINDFCIKNKTKFVYSSAVGSKGYVFNIIPTRTACLRCFLKEAAQLDTCETVGVLNTITNVISSIQVNEAIKILLNKNDIEKNLLFFDVWMNELTKMKVNKGNNCICCIKRDFEYLNGKKQLRIVKLCGDNVYQIKTKSIDKNQFNELKTKFKKIGKIIDFDYCISFNNKITLFNDGRALIKAKDEKEAKSLYSKFVGN